MESQADFAASQHHSRLRSPAPILYGIIHPALDPLKLVFGVTTTGLSRLLSSNEPEENTAFTIGVFPSCILLHVYPERVEQPDDALRAAKILRLGNYSATFRR